MRTTASFLLLAAVAAGDLPAQQGATAVADDSDRIVRVDHYVPTRTLVPAMRGGVTQIYVREKATLATVARGASENRVVLFVHGAGTPAEVTFDVPVEGYSWMDHLARAGFDAFAVDMTGYGRSTRPAPMDDPCNLSADEQAAFVPRLLTAPCEPTYPHILTTIESDWADIDAAVEYIRLLRGVDRVSLVAWSLGGPRAGGYAARHPDKVDRLVLLAPAYGRGGSLRPDGEVPRAGLPMNLQSRSDFVANWDRQVGCADQYDPAVREAVWRDMLESDPVGATWGDGYRRAPRTQTWGWNQEVVAGTRAPTLVVAGIHDGQVPPQRPTELYEDLGSTEKVLIDLGCSSHNAMWERNRLLLFDASLEWLTRGTVDGKTSGVIRMGYR